jgi:hypothetical protein
MCRWRGSHHCGHGGAGGQPGQGAGGQIQKDLNAALQAGQQATAAEQ